MKVKLSLMLMVAALISVPAYAQATLAGKWVGELSATDGHGVAQPVTLDLKIEGDAVSGTVTEGALEARPIVGASTEGSTVTFRTTRNLGGSDINVNWKGELKGEDLTMTREIGPAPAEAGGGRGGRGGGAAPAAGGRGGRGGAAPAAGGQRGAAPAAAAPAAAAPVPPAPTPQAAETPDANAAANAGAAAGGRGGARGGRGGAPAAAGGAAPAQGGRGAAAPAPGPTVTLILHRSR
jgi:hypothetical protein